MKVTLDIPDELYRRVKSRSAMEGRPVRAVAIALFEQWLGINASSARGERTQKQPITSTRFDNDS